MNSKKLFNFQPISKSFLVNPIKIFQLGKIKLNYPDHQHFISKILNETN